MQGKRLAVLTVATLAGGLTVVPLSASAATADTGRLVTLTAKYLRAENGLLVRDGASFAPHVALTSRFTEESRQRAISVRQDRQTLDIGEVAFTGLRTRVTLVRTIRSAPGESRLVVHETTAYPYADGSGLDYTYAIDHTMRYVRANGTWRLDGIHTDDPSGIQLRRQRTPEQQNETLAEARRGYAAIHSAARRRHKSVTTNAAGLNYQKAANWAYYYSTHKVDYTRDHDDCTTFVSMALKHGGWKEKHGWYRSDHVWWYNCDWCIPRHSYTFGGAANWPRFALWSKRTYLLSNVWYMGLADVLQFAHSPHGAPGHTMIVTRFDRNGNPLLSQHGYDASGIPLQLVLDHNPGMPFWAHRT